MSDRCCQIRSEILGQIHDEEQAHIFYHQLAQELESINPELSKALAHMSDNEFKHSLVLRGVGEVLNEQCDCDSVTSWRGKMVEDMGLSTRTLQILARAGIKTAGDLANKSQKQLMVLRNMGQRSMNEINEQLAILRDPWDSLTPDERMVAVYKTSLKREGFRPEIFETPITCQRCGYGPYQFENDPRCPACGLIPEQFTKQDPGWLLPKQSDGELAELKCQFCGHTWEQVTGPTYPDPQCPSCGEFDVLPTDFIFKMKGIRKGLNIPDPVLKKVEQFESLIHDLALKYQLTTGEVSSILLYHNYRSIDDIPSGAMEYFEDMRSDWLRGK